MGHPKSGLCSGITWQPADFRESYIRPRVLCICIGEVPSWCRTAVENRDRFSELACAWVASELSIRADWLHGGVG
jgi:hypothetical protein